MSGVTRYFGVALLMDSCKTHSVHVLYMLLQATVAVVSCCSHNVDRAIKHCELSSSRCPCVARKLVVVVHCTL